MQEREVTDVSRHRITHNDNTRFIINRSSLHNYRHIKELLLMLPQQEFYEIPPEKRQQHHFAAAVQVRDKAQQAKLARDMMERADLMSPGSDPLAVSLAPAPDAIVSPGENNSANTATASGSQPGALEALPTSITTNLVPDRRIAPAFEPTTRSAGPSAKTVKTVKRKGKSKELSGSNLEPASALTTTSDAGGEGSSAPRGRRGTAGIDDVISGKYLAESFDFARLTIPLLRSILDHHLSGVKTSTLAKGVLVDRCIQHIVPQRAALQLLHSRDNFIHLQSPNDQVRTILHRFYHLFANQNNRQKYLA